MFDIFFYFQLILSCALLATAYGGYINAPLTLSAGRSFPLPAPGYTAPAAVAIHAPSPASVVHTRVEPYDPNPQYAYSYDVNDHVTGDSKSQVY